MDVGTKKLQFVYHTKVNGYSFNESLKILFEFILEHFDHSLDKESIVQLYEVYQKVIVGDYDPFNLMRMFGIKKVKKQEESVIQDMPEKRDKEIKTVIAEQMISDKEEKADESDVNIRRVIIGVVSMAFGLLSIFVPGLIPFRIPSVLSFNSFLLFFSGIYSDNSIVSLHISSYETVFSSMHWCRNRNISILQKRT